MATLSDKSRAEYELRVNRVIDHIRANLGGELTLDELAGVACFSAFHFHRIFKAITGENLMEHIQRTRLERAATDLALRPEATVLEIALGCGFGSASAFARAFKERFGVSATEWRKGRCGASNEGKADSNAGQAKGKGGEAAGLAGEQGAPAPRHRGRGQETPMNVKIETLPPCRIAYIRHVGPYGSDGIAETWRRLSRWAAARDLWTPQRVCFGLSYDNPKVTAPERCRYDAAIELPEGVAADGAVNTLELPGGKYAAASYRGGAMDIGAAYDELFGVWLPQSGFQPDERPMFERYTGDPTGQDTSRFVCDICLPVRPL